MKSGAIGMRNPYRWTFDRLTGEMYIADVGQNSWEEIDYEPAGFAGGRNYGWDLMEASIALSRHRIAMTAIRC
jgi:glucose/arabinose dehydrogenase